jgi:hypothetical protein
VTVRVLTAWNCNQGLCNRRKKTFKDFSDSVMRDIYISDEHGNVQTAAATSRKLHFATSFSVRLNQLHGHF